MTGNVSFANVWLIAVKPSSTPDWYSIKKVTRKICQKEEKKKPNPKLKKKREMSQVKRKKTGEICRKLQRERVFNLLFTESQSIISTNQKVWDHKKIKATSFFYFTRRLTNIKLQERMEQFIWFEISLWIVLFILLLLLLRAILKLFFPNRAIFRSGNDVKRKRRDEEEEEEEDDEKLMEAEKSTANGQR